jgi:hypothetical protein
MANEAAPATATTRAGPTAPAPELGEALRAVAVAALAGAAVIHFAYAPSHFDEQASHGVFFLVVAWAQVAAALGLARWRNRPEPWLAAAVLSAGVLAVWLGSRTIGVPESHHDSIGLADGLASALEAVVVAAAAVALRPSLARRPAPRLNPLAAGVGALALVGVVSVSVTPSVAGEDGAGHSHTADGAAAEHAGGHAHGAAPAAGSVAREDRCDLGFNTVGFNGVAQPGEPHVHDDSRPVDFTIEQWADVFVDPRGPLPAEAVVSFLEDRPLLRDGILSGGLTHTLAPDPWNPMTDPAECEQLAGELRRARDVAAQFPTAADAMAAGYRKVTNYYPGIAAHYINADLVDERFDVDHPEMLLYDGDGPRAGMVGLSYYIMKDGDEEPTVGFTGPNDHYHRHVGLCFRDGVVVAGSNSTDEECEAAGGTKGIGFGGWMSHVWIVPGCESAWGVFSGANPALTVRGIENSAEVPTGCGTGRSLDDRLAFDTGGDGPRI